jgi:hypothetical protein|tara:strand:- start:76 stop:477 length:402 start_codon:yes stop_codon:yes gene_type:complete
MSIENKTNGKKSFMQKAYEKLMILLNNSTSLRVVPCLEDVNGERVRRLVLCYHDNETYTPLMFILDSRTTDSLIPFPEYTDGIWNLIEEAKGIDQRSTMEEFDISVDKINDLFWNSEIIDEIDDELKKVMSEM